MVVIDRQRGGASEPENFAALDLDGGHERHEHVLVVVWVVDDLHVLVLRIGWRRDESREIEAEASEHESHANRHRNPHHGFLQLDVTILLRYCKAKAESQPLGRNRLIRDRDRVYGAAVTRRLRAMSVRDKPIAPGSPWQNGFTERLIGSIRRECVDHMMSWGSAVTKDSDEVCRLLERVEDSSVSR